jgi:formylglycine-generating enzyme required for sulfatase activity
MKNNLIKSINDLMKPIPGGNEIIREYQDDSKWISSNSKMSVPGEKGNWNIVESKILIEPFLFSKFPVTNSLYTRFIEKLRTEKKDNFKPIVNVSWYDAILFCNLLSRECSLKECYTLEQGGKKVLCDWEANGFRLPRESEWQYACKASTIGYQYGEINEISWNYENSGGRMHEVGKKEPNKWGLYDMLGNTYEWCWDLYNERKYGQYRVFRGGSWAEKSKNCGATSRRRGHPSFRIDDLGFRLAKNL